MWLFTTVGFFSIVRKPGTAYLTVRARARGDLENLRARYLPELSASFALPASDYPWRATVAHEAFAKAAAAMVIDVTYDNFKDQVRKTQGSARAHAYHDVWAAVQNLNSTPWSCPQPGKWIAEPLWQHLCRRGWLLDLKGPAKLTRAAKLNLWNR